MAFTWVRDPNAAVDPATVVAPTVVVDDPRRREVAALLPKMYLYLRDQAPGHPGLAKAIDEMHSAVAAHQSAQPGDPFGPLQRVLQVIEEQRRLDPSIPQP